MDSFASHRPAGVTTDRRLSRFPEGRIHPQYGGKYRLRTSSGSPKSAQPSKLVQAVRGRCKPTPKCHSEKGLGSSASSQLCGDSRTTVKELGSTTVKKLGSTTVKELGSTTVKELGSTTVKELGSTTVKELGSTTVKELGSTTVKELGSTTVKELGSSQSADAERHVRY